jgi:YD repeat-containing protein
LITPAPVKIDLKLITRTPPQPDRKHINIPTKLPGGVAGPNININIDFPDPSGSNKRSNIFESKSQQTEPGDYLGAKAPLQVEPGKTRLEGQYVDKDGNVMPWVAHYDEFGRLIGRTDYDDPDTRKPNPHYHTYEWGPGKNPQEIEGHVPGEFEP